MRILYNDPKLTHRRQSLRNPMPMAELVLWQYLKGKQIGGFKFRRQYGVGPYVIDFYCPKLRLAIEVDGGSHFTPEAIEYDLVRQTFIESFNIRFLRITNNKIYENLDGVIEAIQKAAKDMSSNTGTNPN